MGDDGAGSLGADDSPSPQYEPKFPTVGIGASAGGLKVLQTFFEAVEPDLGAAFVVIVHLDPEHQSQLAEILATHTKMPVAQVGRKMPLEPNKVYVIPPNRRLLISDQEISTHAFDEPRGRRSPIDQFFRSLADQHGDGFAIVFSGAGSDGALGTKAIKEAGGLILVQDPAEAEYPSMPRSAIAAGYADVVMPARKLAAELGLLIRAKKHLPTADLIDGDDVVLRRVLTYLRARTGHDFTAYKRPTIIRRVTRRMQVCRVDRLDDYYALLRGNPDEVQALFADLLISVTMFFRDPTSFAVLAAEALSKIFDDADDEKPIRAWVPGCATGEEAYSVAILLMDEAAKRGSVQPIQVFATDLDANALSVAREGRYPSTIEADVNEEHLRRYFAREGDYYRVKRELRDFVMFASHSILKDPPFSHVDLVSCRNLLIYLDRELQQQVMSTFHYALKPGGFLFLGSSEAAEQPSGLFQTVNRDARLYQSLHNGRERALPRINLSPGNGDLLPVSVAPRYAAATSQQLHHRALEESAPPSILVDRAYRVMHISETASRYFQPSAGPLPTDITELVWPELRSDLRSCLEAAFHNGRPDLSLPIPVHFDGSRVRVYMQVKPLADATGPAQRALVVFVEGGLIPSEAESAMQSDALSEQHGRLLQELELMRSRLSTSRDERVGVTEELRAANEELQSINEEYRSTSEELETNKEELQSINEELTTVNSELKSKLESVSRTNSDLLNLMAATDVGTLFLDTELRIKRFTPSVASLVNITPADEGRSITDFTNHLEYEALPDDARAVLQNLVPVEREIRSRERWFLTRIRPYRTMDNRIDGVVVTLFEITARVKAEAALRTSEGRLRLLLQELSHRVKNTLAIVQSMARLSFTGRAGHKIELAIFSGRLIALAGAHELLVRNEWEGANLNSLVTRQLGPHISGLEGQVTISGDEVLLPPDTATPFALIVHELATNAVKYGALSHEQGTLAVSWHFDQVTKTLDFCWVERGGEGGEQPSNKGFGTYLLEKGLPRADVKRTFEPEGLTCSIKMPLQPPNLGQIR